LSIAAGIYAVLLYFVGPGEVIDALSGADPVLVALGGFLMLLWNVAWGISLWNVLKTQNAKVPLPKAILLQASAAFANNVTPLGQAGGEPITAWLITKSTDTDYEVSLASVASFDALHIVPSLLFSSVGAVYLLSVTTVGNELGILPVAVLATALGVPVLGYVAWQNRRRIGRRVRSGAVSVVRSVTKRVPGISVPDTESIEKSIGDFAKAVERVAGDRKRLALAIGFSTLGSVLQAAAMLVIFQGLSAPIPVFVPLVVIPIAATSGGVPTPGGLGGTEAVSITLLLLLTNVAESTVVAAVAIHSTGGFLLTTGVGAVAASVLGIREFG
jgi:uncharacterized protein (TIRG00374 family)